MEWVRKGLIYCANGEADWQKSHASIPTPWMKPDGNLRLYVGFCSAGELGTDVSRIGYIDVDPDDPSRVLQISQRPCLDIGASGCFDDNGVMPISVVEKDGKIYLYYAGFQLQTLVRYTIFAGVAISSDNGETFTRHSSVPLLERSNGEKFFRTAPTVLQEGNIWRMWYIGGGDWIKDTSGKERPYYTLRHIQSSNLLQWPPQGDACMQPSSAKGSDEYGFGRPVVMRRKDDSYVMLYSVRNFSTSYKLDWATSADGFEWVRQSGITLSGDAGAWESGMQCYGIPFIHKNKTWLFYNGNNFGATGVGYAELTQGKWL